jgi:hypothetical protein
MYEQEAYCNMLVKYREELTRPVDEAMDFLKRVEAQLDSISGAAGGSTRLSLAGKNLLQLLFISRTWSYGGRVFFYFTRYICSRYSAYLIGKWLFWIVGAVALDLAIVS